jgi:hypothetical protein
MGTTQKYLSRSDAHDLLHMTPADAANDKPRVLSAGSIEGARHRRPRTYSWRRGRVNLFHESCREPTSGAISPSDTTRREPFDRCCCLFADCSVIAFLMALRAGGIGDGGYSPRTGSGGVNHPGIFRLPLGSTKTTTDKHGSAILTGCHSLVVEIIGGMQWLCCGSALLCLS